MRLVLGSLGQLLIRGEFRNYEDAGGLDSVVLHMGSPPEPVLSDVVSTFDNDDHGWS